MVRRPAVAGSFYPGTPEALRKEVLRHLKPVASPAEVRALLVPHAGYEYSGPVAGETFGAARLPSSLVILCPNHTGLGEPIAVDPSGEWETPLGRVQVDEELARAILERCPQASEDRIAHRHEHALEVELPFLQVLLEKTGFRFVPICIGTHRVESLRALGEAMASAIREVRPEAAIVLSSDMTHYESHDSATARDRYAIAALEALDPQKLLEEARERDITMCGIFPAIAGLEACRKLGVKGGRLVRYATSAEASGDYDRVVGYAGVLFL